ncbi:MAG: ZPR1 zinc finger domain-containing protein [Promethearchaeota archaeon]
MDDGRPFPRPEPVDLGREIRCPACDGGKLTVTKTVYEFPHHEETALFLLFKCSSCSYSKSDVVPLETKFGVGKFTLRVVGGDLTSKLFRAPTASVSIPELGVEVNPGPAAEFMLTNVEGFLDRVVMVTRGLVSSTEAGRRAAQVLEDVEKVLRGEMDVTIVLEDPVGGSYVVPCKPELLKFEPIDAEAEDG